MPYKISKNKSGGYKVTGPSGVHAKNTSLKNAKAQVRIMSQSEKKKK